MMSQIEQTLRAIIDGTEYTDAPQSRIEAILYAIANDLEEIPLPYTGTPLSRIEELLVQIKENGGGGEPITVKNPALRLMDWEGTVLKEYTAEQVASLTALPDPSSLNTNADRDLLSFQGYNWSISDIKSWVTAHEGQCLTVGAIYTTTDGQDHNYWNNPRLTTATTISKHKRGTTAIGNNAFKDYFSLTNINIPDGVTTIGDGAFGNCYSLTNINIPDGVIYIWGSAFNGCRSLTSVNIPDSVTTIGSNVFNGCACLTNVNIPDGVTSIGSGAFSWCYSLTNINIPDGVTTIGDGAFGNCYSLTSVNIPDSVTSIGGNAFSNCYSLTSVNIPDSVTSIGGNAFNNNKALADVVIQGKPSLANVNAFENTHANLRIYVPREYLSWYESETNWTTFYDSEVIVAIEDYIEYLTSIGIDVSEYEEEQI